MTEAYEVSGLWRYPVKSMVGEAVDVVDLDADGVVGDRRWAVRDLETGRLASAKKPCPFGGLLHWSARTVEGGTVEVMAPDGQAWTAGDPGLDAALCEAFGRPVALVGAEEGRSESYDAEWERIPGALSSVQAEVPMGMLSSSNALVDASAVHLVTAEAMDHLAELVGEVVALERFRPTALLRSVDGDGLPGFADLDWGEVGATLGGASLQMAGAMPRCVMTTLSQRGLEQAREGLQALSAHARRDTPIGNMPCIGTMAEVTGPGTVRLGDRFTMA